MKKFFAYIVCLAILLAMPVGIFAFAENSERTVQTVSAGKMVLPEVISLETAKDAQHIKRLAEKEDGLDTLLFENSDGTETLYVFGENVKYINENGEVKDKSNTLTVLNEKSDYGRNFQYVNRENDIRTYFPKQISSESGIRLEFQNYNLTLYPAFESAGSKKSVAALSSSNENCVSYSNVFNEQTELRAIPTFNGFVNQFTFSQAPEKENYEFIIHTADLELVLSQRGDYIHIKDSLSQRIVGQISGLSVFCSSNKIANCRYELRALEKNYWSLVVVIGDIFTSSASSSAVTTSLEVIINNEGSAEKKIKDMSLMYSGNNDYSSGTVFRDGEGDLYAQRFVTDQRTSESRFVIGFPGLDDPTNTNSNLNFLGGRGTITAANLWLHDITDITAQGWVDGYTYLSDWEETYSANNGATATIDEFTGEGTFVATRGVGGGVGFPAIGQTTGSGNWYNFDIGSAIRDWIHSPEGANVGTATKGLMFKVYQGENVISHTFESTECGANRVCLVITYRNMSFPVEGGRLADGFGCTCSVHNGIHRGQDINGVSEGTPIKASGMGKVIFKGGSTTASYGYYVGIRYGNNHVALYAHMQAESTVVVGNYVYQDSVIGYVGNTGNSHGAHLHLGVAGNFPANLTGDAAYYRLCRNQLWIDPKIWLETGGAI